MALRANHSRLCPWPAAVASSALALGLLGCSGADQADSLGVFAVSGSLSETCGQRGLLAVPDNKELVVELKRLGTALHWLEGSQRLIGTVDSDDTFRFETYLRVDMRQDTPDAALPACVIERYDQKVGTLHMDATQTCTGFSGQLIYYLAPTQSSDCSDLLAGDSAIADELPCTITYGIEAEPLEE